VFGGTPLTPPSTHAQTSLPLSISSQMFIINPEVFHPPYITVKNIAIKI
jgi:hypothetical protein